MGICARLRVLFQRAGQMANRVKVRWKTVPNEPIAAIGSTYPPESWNGNLAITFDARTPGGSRALYHTFTLLCTCINMPDQIAQGKYIQGGRQKRSFAVVEQLVRDGSKIENRSGIKVNRLANGMVSYCLPSERAPAAAALNCKKFRRIENENQGKRKWDDRLATTSEIRGNTAQEWRHGWTREIGSRGAGHRGATYIYIHNTGAHMTRKRIYSINDSIPALG